MWDWLSPGKLLCGRNGEWTTSCAAEMCQLKLQVVICCAAYLGTFAWRENCTSQENQWFCSQAGCSTLHWLLFPRAFPVSSAQVLLADYWVNSCHRNTRHFPGDSKCDLWWNLKYSLKSNLFSRILQLNLAQKLQDFTTSKKNILLSTSGPTFPHQSKINLRPWSLFLVYLQGKCNK